MEALSARLNRIRRNRTKGSYDRTNLQIDRTRRILLRQATWRRSMSSQNLYSPMGALTRMTNGRSRSISAENPTGEKGKGGMATPDEVRSLFQIKPTEGAAHPSDDLGQGWKVAPFIWAPANET